MPPDAPHSPEPSDDPDQLLKTAADAVELRADTSFDRFVLRTTAWFGAHTTIRLVVAGTALIGALLPGVVLLFNPGLTDGLAGFGYFGVFLTNLASTATFYFPVPGLTAAAQTLIATEGENDNFPWLVGIAGGIGMAVGEVTAYYAGYLGAEMVRGRELPGPKRFHSTINRITARISWLMDRWGMATLFTLSALPNPLFEIAGLTAGSVRMPFRRFLVSVTSGKIVRGVLIAYYGADFLDALRSVLPFV